MCQIVVINSSKKLERQFLENQFRANSDGIGIAYYSNGKWYWKKFMDFQTFYNFYNNLNYNKAVIHFRAGTSGLKDISNVHPFLISRERREDLEEGELRTNEMLLFQNGITNDVFKIYKFVFGTDANKECDTRILAKLFVMLEVFDVEEIKNKIKAIDGNSRFVIVKGNSDEIIKLGDFKRYNDDVELSSWYYYYRFRKSDEIRLDVASDIERAISNKIKVPYLRVNLYYNKETKLFTLKIDDKKLVFGVKGLKRYLKKLGIENWKELIEKLREELKRRREIEQRIIIVDDDFNDEWRYYYRYYYPYSYW